MAKYLAFAVLIVIVNFTQSFFLPSGGVYADSLSYFGIAVDLPNPVTNLFPIGYPAALRVFFEICKDYFWASKFLNSTMILVILLFYYFKKFYFRETVLLLAGKTALFVFGIAISESLFIFLLYFLIYCLHKIVSVHQSLYKMTITGSIILIAMFTVRYSAIYIFLSLVVFTVFLFLKDRNNPKIKEFGLLVFLSGLGIGGYLIFNFTEFGSFTGENLRGKPAEILPVYVVRDLFGVANAINPYIGLKPSSNSFASLAFQFFILLIDIGVFVYLLKYFKKAKVSGLYDFHIVLWMMAFGYAISLMVSGWFQQIEEMNIRMMAATNICIFFSFLILYYKDLRSDKLIFRIGVVFFIFNTVYTLKNPVNYFENRKQIEPQVSSFKDKKFLFIKEKEEASIPTTYYIPIINKTFQYQHTNNQKGDVKQSIVGTLNPKIKWQKYDTIKDKSQVLYTSEIILK